MTLSVKLLTFSSFYSVGNVKCKSQTGVLRITLSDLCLTPSPIICTLLDGLASPSVPVSPILDFVLAYQVTLIEIRKCTERGGTKDIQKTIVCCRESILNMMGFGQGRRLSC